MKSFELRSEWWWRSRGRLYKVGVEKKRGSVGSGVVMVMARGRVLMTMRGGLEVNAPMM